MINALVNIINILSLKHGVEEFAEKYEVQGLVIQEQEKFMKKQHICYRNRRTRGGYYFSTPSAAIRPAVSVTMTSSPLLHLPPVRMLEMEFRTLPLKSSATEC